MKIIFLLTIALSASCTFRKSKLENQTLKGHNELYSGPKEIKLSNLPEGQKRIVIASTNDMHGNYESQVVSFKDDHNKDQQTIAMGGKEVIKNYFSILRENYKNVVLVDSGDIFSNTEAQVETQNFYESLKYDALTLGLRDFNLKMPAKMTNNIEFFQAFAKSSTVPMLLGNLYELKTARIVEWSGTKPYVLKEIDGIKVGIIGLISDDIVNQTPINNRIGLYVENMLQSTLRHARLLRSLGADVIVVVTHQGIDCNSELANEKKLPVQKVNFDPRQENICNIQNDLGEYLSRLPHELVDVVVGGRNHQKMANIVNGIVVMGSFPDGKAFNYTELIVDSKTKKVIDDKTVVHQPIMFCQDFFKETNDCFTDDSTINHNQRIPATFLGSPIQSKSEKISLKVERKDPKDLQKGMNLTEADITYSPESSGDTQLVVLKLTGAEISKVLEEDFNSGLKSAWLPSPFILKNNELVLSFSGMEIHNTQTYRILTDLESAQSHSALKKFIGRAGTEVSSNISWGSTKGEDTISSLQAAPFRN